MPKLKPNLSPTTPWTKVPNVLLDRLMPSLKDTELRIMLVLLRQTLGWNREDRPVTLTYRSLTGRTGRGSEAVSKAIGSLSARGLIHTHGRRTFRKPEGDASKPKAQQRTEMKKKNSGRPFAFPQGRPLKGAEGGSGFPFDSACGLWLGADLCDWMEQ